MLARNASSPMEPPTGAKRRAMQSQRVRDTGPEMELRKRLHARGLRYRLHRHVVPGTRRAVDVVFGSACVAVDVRGCFWHGCPLHGTKPKANAEWWAAKLERNRTRDQDTERRLTESGWQLIVVWECDDMDEAAGRVEGVVRLRSGRG
jgi:DNA mismatch endonuclease (patch repair protein)